MNEKDYRKRIGKKLEEAYLSQPMGETPSKETFAKWIEIAEQKRAERRRHRRKLVSCAAALVMCVVLGVACIFDPPQVAAGGKGGSKIEANLETSDVYKTQDSLPQNAKETFLLFTELPIGYNEAGVTIEKTNNVEMFSLRCTNVAGEELLINEVKSKEDDSLLNIVDSQAEKETVKGRDVYINRYSEDAQKTTYTFVENNLLIVISTPNGLEQEEIIRIIEKTVR